MQFMKNTLLALFLVAFCMSKAQQTDTLKLFSKAFDEERTVFIRLPEFYAYQSEEIRLPVFIILDGQHEWFVNPLLSTIRYLHYTHQIPQALTVIVPHNNRYEECTLPDLAGETLPLHVFLTEELYEALKSYNPGNYRLLIGHSLTASFALYSYLKAPGFYAGIFANTPADMLEEVLLALEKHPSAELNKIYISAGSPNRTKDIHHRKLYDKLKANHPRIFEGLNTLESNAASHNAVPIVAMPTFLNDHFYDFSIRFDDLAVVDKNYILINNPGNIEDELVLLNHAARLGNTNYPPEIPEINGIASRYLNNGYVEHAIAVFEFGRTLYPGDYEFYLILAELYFDSNKKKSRELLMEAVERIRLNIKPIDERENLISEITRFLEDDVW